MNSEILSTETATKLAEYEQIKVQRDYYKTEYKLLVSLLKDKNKEITRLKKEITALKSGGKK